MNEKTSVICSVYSKDPNRFSLLEVHNKNLLDQTVNVKPIYIFENGDVPPISLKGDIIVCNNSMTIYEAWNLGLSLCRTPFIMNLNLDDRLQKDSIEIMEKEIIDKNGDLISGDWKVCYSQLETDAIDKCYPAEIIDFLPTWPPENGSKTRLGSGTGHRGTFGPAVMWKISLHTQFPRYPYRTTDDYRIQSVADAIWWNLLRTNLKNLIRLPLIIGNYHSHPDFQAEFRTGDEWSKIKEKSISLL